MESLLLRDVRYLVKVIYTKVYRNGVSGKGGGVEYQILEQYFLLKN